MTEQEEVLLEIAKLALKQCQRLRGDVLEVVHGVPGDGALPEEIQLAPITVGTLMARANGTGMAIGSRTFADHDMVVVDLGWCAETIKHLEAQRRRERKPAKKKSTKARRKKR